MESTKKRTPSQCREWERQRRNKFNEAIVKLGEVVKTVNSSSDNDGKDTDNGQYPKIEIIQKAIICITTFIQEKTLLKAEILALQVKLEAIYSKNDKKDASTQVFIRINRKSKGGNGKLFTTKKTKESQFKEKPIIKQTAIIPKSKAEAETIAIVNENKLLSGSLQKLPKLLPRSNLDKRGTENTIVVLPAAPYIFPQRPLLFPTVPPAFVLLDSNLQALNKPPVSIVCSRNGGDVTKTTMVNILPIAAYSRPLSATKVKKNGSKAKKYSIKKSNTKLKPVKEVANSKKDVDSKEINNESSEKDKNYVSNDGDRNTSRISLLEKDSKLSKSPTCDVTDNITESKNPKNNSIDSKEEANGNDINKKIVAIAEKVVSASNNKSDKSVTADKATDNINNSNINDVSFTKLSPVENKDKEKLPNILDTTLCEHTVCNDGGNARLELAEELLAASPTAAFLMSFPLVSGNRADSPVEESQNIPNKETNQRRNDVTSQVVAFYEKSNDSNAKLKAINKPTNESNSTSKEQKYVNSATVSKQNESKLSNEQPVTIVSTDNPFLNLSMPSIISTSCTMTDSNFGLEFDCNITKSTPSISSQPTNYATSNNLFYKNDPFNTVKSSIYSTSAISSGHEFNSLGLYPCAMEKYASKNKSEYVNMEDNIMKMGSSRLTYDIDLGWSHKSLDFVNCTTTSNTFNKDIIIPTTASSYSTSYNPFNPEFHMPFVSSSNKKDFSSKPSTSFTDSIASFYSQPASLWSEEAPFYTNNNISKTLTTKESNYNVDYSLSNNNQEKNLNIVRQYENKQVTENILDNRLKPPEAAHQVVDKYAKKAISNKMHINWMTSEVRTLQNNCDANTSDVKIAHKNYSHHIEKKQVQTDSNCFPMPVHNFSSQINQDEFQVWPSIRPIGTTEISIEPPVNLPTLVGDLALGPHDKKKNVETVNRTALQSDAQNCSNFFSVTQLMNRSSGNMSSRYLDVNTDTSKTAVSKNNITHFVNDLGRKAVSARVDNSLTQPCYPFSDPKPLNSYDSVNQFSHNKSKTNKTEKTSKAQKHSYSAEALIRGGTCAQKVNDTSSTKFIPHQKYNDYTAQDASVAQVSHFPQILDYSDNSYSQQFVGTTLYNSSSNTTLANSFYSNFIPGSSNLMPTNYANGPLASDYIDYSQTTQCNYTNHKYEDIKLRNNTLDKSHYKSSRRENTAKHKLECSKKDSSKKYQSKKPKLNNEVEDWNDTPNLSWQNKTSIKRHPNVMSEDLPYHNYVGNQVPTQYQPEYFNSHRIPSNMQGVGNNIERSFTSFPATSRANFNLSTIFPEITMKVQS